MAVDVANVHIFGSDDDALWLGPPTLDLSSVTLTSTPPATMVECGWLSDEGGALKMSDSVKSIKGHQGGAEITQFMDESTTAFTAVLLETKLDIVLWALSATATKETGTPAYAKIHAKRSRKVEKLVAIWDTFDTEHPGVRYRYICPLASLGERGDLAFKRGEISGWNYSLGILKDFDILTNAEQILAELTP